MYNYNNFTDNELFELSQGGDQSAFEEIYKRFSGLLYIYAKKLIKNDEDAQDIVQEVFVYLWNNQKIRLNAQLSAYLYTAVRYKIFDWIDKNKIRTNYATSLRTFIEQGELVTDNYLREKELIAIIEKEVNKLPSKMRQIFEMSRNLHLSQKEIALQLQISDKTVKKQMGNALKILRLKLTSFLTLITLLISLTRF
ncbi:RNA polymerase sigma-70 factor (ECF subfamily) [Pedobacter sp. UYP30]|uniref:RNA polymerase sigma-70 factor n=1 Tax=Pedobacter sp. UYP30 TaxID=1756400 RepID=UPI0033981724